MEVQDPVCGMRFDEARAQTTVTYRDVTYHFCSEHCKTAFEQDKDRYIEGGK